MGFVQVSRDGNNQTRATHAKDISLIILGGCTKYIEAPDVVWNRPFKANVAEQYDEWMAGEAHSFTAAANMRYNNNNNNNNEFIIVWITSSSEESAMLIGETWLELSKMAATTSI